MQTKQIKINGHTGTWGVIETKQYENRTLVLLEHEEYGDETAFMIAELETKRDWNEEYSEFVLVMDCAWNGFDDLDYELDNGKSIGWLILAHFLHNELEA